MIYILDTDILSLLAHSDSPEAPRIRRRIAEIPQDDSIVTTVINYEEQMRGWMGALAKARSPRDEIAIYDRLLRHLSTFRRMEVLPYDDDAEAVREQFRNERIKISAMDMKIAAITLSRNAVLITRNAVDFRKIPRLQIDDWSAS